MSTDTNWETVFLATEEETTKGSYGYEYESIDFTVLSVVVATLGLVLCVELVRHKIDHLAKGRPFFTELITCVNSECKFDCLESGCSVPNVTNSRLFYISGYARHCRVCLLSYSEIL
jgi:hypothetical protein